MSWPWLLGCLIAARLGYCLGLDVMEHRMAGRVHMALRLLDKARQPKITILAAPEREKPERFDWKAGVGVE